MDGDLESIYVQNAPCVIEETIYSKSSLQRHAHDAEATTHHFTVALYTWEEAGRVILGRQWSPVF